MDTGHESLEKMWSGPWEPCKEWTRAMRALKRTWSEREAGHESLEKMKKKMCDRSLVKTWRALWWPSLENNVKRAMWMRTDRDWWFRCECLNGVVRNKIYLCEICDECLNGVVWNKIYLCEICDQFLSKIYFQLNQNLEFWCFPHRTAFCLIRGCP